MRFDAGSSRGAALKTSADLKVIAGGGLKGLGVGLGVGVGAGAGGPVHLHVFGDINVLPPAVLQLLSVV